MVLFLSVVVMVSGTCTVTLAAATGENLIVSGDFTGENSISETSASAWYYNRSMSNLQMITPEDESFSPPYDSYEGNYIIIPTDGGELRNITASNLISEERYRISGYYKSPIAGNTFGQIYCFLQYEDGTRETIQDLYQSIPSATFPATYNSETEEYSWRYFFYDITMPKLTSEQINAGAVGYIMRIGIGAKNAPKNEMPFYLADIAIEKWNHILTNFGFEDAPALEGQAPASWEIQGGDKGTYEYLPTGGVNNSACISVTSTDRNTFFGLRQVLPTDGSLAANTPYTLSFVFKSETENSVPRIRMNFTNDAAVDSIKHHMYDLTHNISMSERHFAQGGERKGLETKYLLTD